MEKAFVRKVKGRFIKNDDPIRDSVSITDFNLLDICETEITYADNVDANIIHTRLHLEQSIDEGVKASKEINSIFEPTEYRPVIKPLDFTQEWIKQKKRMHSRHSRIDEEDEVDLEMENIAKKLKSKFGKKKKIGKKAEPNTLKSSEEVGEKKINDGLEKAPKEDSSDYVEPSDSYKIIGDAINQITEQEDALTSLNPIDNKPVIEKSAGEKINVVQQEIEKPKNVVNEFIPMQEEFKPQITDEEIEQIKEEAKSTGFEAGYRDGEEKATLVHQEKMSAVSDQLKDAMNQIESLKHSVLKNVQSNFEVLCRSMIESMLHREFQLNPSSFQTFLERAVTEAVPDDDFKILVSLESYESLKGICDENLMSKLKIDESLEGNNFKIESNLTVVDGNIHQIIEELLKQVDLNLFDQEG